MSTTTNSTAVTWMWKANLDPFAQDEEEEWRNYTEEQNATIENAYQNNEDGVYLKNYYIDFNRLEQKAIDDKTKRRPIKRVKHRKGNKRKRFVFHWEKYLVWLRIMASMFKKTWCWFVWQSLRRNLS